MNAIIQMYTKVYGQETLNEGCCLCVPRATLEPLYYLCDREQDRQTTNRQILYFKVIYGQKDSVSQLQHLCDRETDRQATNGQIIYFKVIYGQKIAYHNCSICVTDRHMDGRTDTSLAQQLHNPLHRFLLASASG